MIFLRGVVWSLHGLIYAPLFLGLLEVFRQLGAGSAAFLGAGALAGAASATLYGTRQIALIGTGVGLVVGTVFLMSDFPGLGLVESLVVSASAAALIGLWGFLPQRCTREAPAKFLAGLTGGTVGGCVLAVAEPLYPAAFPIFAIVAFLVSVNGVLYVASVRGWIVLIHRLRPIEAPCRLIQSPVLAVLAALAAGSVWVMAGLLTGTQTGLVAAVGHAVFAQLPLAALAGAFGGALAGGLLETFGFAWVNDV